jgi:hypothetical protein
MYPSRDIPLFLLAQKDSAEDRHKLHILQKARGGISLAKFPQFVFPSLEAPLFGEESQPLGAQSSPRSNQSASGIDHISPGDNPTGMPSSNNAHIQPLLFQLCQGKKEHLHIFELFFY